MKKQIKSVFLCIVVLTMLFFIGLPNLETARASGIDSLSLTYASPTVTMDKKSVKIDEVLTNTFSGLSFDKVASTNEKEKLSYLIVDIYGQAGYYNDEWTSLSQEFESLIIPRSLAKDASGNVKETDVKITVSFVPNPGVSFDQAIDIVYLDTQFTNQAITISKADMQQFVESNGYTLENISNINIEYSIDMRSEKMGALDVGDITYRTKVVANKSSMRPTDSYTRTIFQTNPGGNNYYDSTITNYLFQAISRFNTADIQIEADKMQGLLPGDELDILFTLENNSSYLNSVIYFGVDDLEGAVELADTSSATTTTDFIPAIPWNHSGSIIRNALFTTTWVPLDAGDKVMVQLKLKVKEDYDGSTIRLQPFTYINNDLDGRSDGNVLELSIQKHTLQFETNGGSNVDSQQITHNHFASEPVAPQKEGHTFNGWFVDKELTTPWDFAVNKVTEDTTLYAKWTVNTYNVSFESNGGTAIGSLNDVAFGTLLTEPTLPIKDGHTFNGWFIDGQLTKQWNFTTDKVVEDMTLYAKWEINTYELEYIFTSKDTPEGLTAPEKVSVEYLSTVTEPVFNDYKDWIFNGWYMDKELTQKFDFTTPMTSDMKLYGAWSYQKEEQTTDSEVIITPNTPNTSEKPNNPATGDQSNSMMYGGLIGISCLSFTVMLLGKKKRLNK